MFFDPFYTARPAKNSTQTYRAPKVFVVVRNTETDALVAGYAVCWHTDGIGVAKPTTAMLNCFAGVAYEAIAAYASSIYSYGLVQVYGYTDTAYVMAAEATAAAGDSLIGVNAAWYMSTQTAANTGLNMGLAQVLEAYTNTTVSAAKKAFIHAM